MEYSYNKLWKLMIDKKINRTTLRKQAGITSNGSLKWARISRSTWKCWRKSAMCQVAALKTQLRLWMKKITNKEDNKMAIKKSELYSSLWASCDALRGGMDASQYKDAELERSQRKAE